MANEQRRTERIIDNPQVGERYANKTIAIAFDGAAVHITFGTSRSTPAKIGDKAGPPPLPEIYVTDRIVLSPSAAVELQQMMGRVINAVSRPADPKQAN